MIWKLPTVLSWDMVADVCITLIVHHDEDKVRRRPQLFSSLHAWIFMHVLIFNRAAKNIRRCFSNQQEKHRVDSSLCHQHFSVSIFSSLILSVFSVLLSLQQINLVQRRSVCPQVQSKSFTRPLLKEFSSVWVWVFLMILSNGSRAEVGGAKLLSLRWPRGW